MWIMRGMPTCIDNKNRIQLLCRSRFAVSWTRHSWQFRFVRASYYGGLCQLWRAILFTVHLLNRAKCQLWKLCPTQKIQISPLSNILRHLWKRANYGTASYGGAAVYNMITQSFAGNRPGNLGCGFTFPMILRAWITCIHRTILHPPNTTVNFHSPYCSNVRYILFQDRLVCRSFYRLGHAKEDLNIHDPTK